MLGQKCMEEILKALKIRSFERNIGKNLVSITLNNLAGHILPVGCVFEVLALEQDFALNK